MNTYQSNSSPNSEIHPYQAINGALGDAVRELCFAGIDPAIVVPVGISAASLLTQGLADIAWSNGQPTSIGANALIVAPSGGGKTVTFKALLPVIAQHLDSITSTSEFKAPITFIEDATREAIIHHLLDVPIAGLFTDEGGQLKQLIKNGASTLAKVLDGDDVRNSRVSTGRIHLSGHRLTMLLAEQPQIFDSTKVLLGASQGGVGLINRFHVAVSHTAPDPAALHRAKLTEAVSEKYAQRVCALLDALVAHMHDKKKRPVLVLSKEAEGYFIDMSVRVLHDMWPTAYGHDITEYVRRHAERVLRSAGVLHVFEHGPQGEIQLSTLQGADLLGRWSIQAYRGLTYTPPKISQMELDAGTLERGLHEALKATGNLFFPLSEMRRCAPNMGLTKSRFERALTFLAGQGKVQVLLNGRADWVQILSYPMLLQQSNPYPRY